MGTLNVIELFLLLSRSETSEELVSFALQLADDHLLADVRAFVAKSTPDDDGWIA